jgi:hypothetical protein
MITSVKWANLKSEFEDEGAPAYGLFINSLADSRHASHIILGHSSGYLGTTERYLYRLIILAILPLVF